MRHNGWRAIGGADRDGTQHYALVAFDGANVHGWVQSVRAGAEPAMGYASANLDEIEEDFKKTVAAAGGDVMRFIGADAEISGQVEVGLFGIGKALKKLAKKTGIAKVLKSAHKIANYALSNPLVQGALAATGPMGMSVLAAHQGYKMLMRAKKGSKKARGFLSAVVKQARGGNPKAAKMLRMLKLGKRAFGRGALARYAVRRGGRPRYGTRKWGSNYQPLCARGRVSGDIQTMVQADEAELGRWLAGGGVAYMGDDGAMMGEDVIVGEDMMLGEDMIVGDDGMMGADAEAEMDQDIQQLNEFAASSGAWEGAQMLGDQLDVGAWEGLAWASDRLGPHSMAKRPNELTARDALLDGRQGQAARFA